ncbi:MAG: ribonuclease Y [Candidatus Liptonbacteria bacterium]|nr:ribonuclease Y [Candidatus Liptonbacteria bacterium]
MTYELVAQAGIFALAGVALGYAARAVIVSRRSASAERSVAERLKEADQKRQEIVLAAKERAASLIEEAVAEEKKRKEQAEQHETRLVKKEESLETQRVDIQRQRDALDQDVARVKLAKTQVDELREKAAVALAGVAGLSADEARAQLFRELEDASRQELTVALQRLERDRREELEKKSCEIMLTAVQRYARSRVSEFTTSVFHLPNEEFKGKIIGREGRNIRALERATGVELIMDENPDAIVISSFDPLRREIARVTLEKLVRDGRIQPAKIEEKTEEARQELTTRMEKIGEEAAYEAGAYNLPKEIVQLLGRLHFRTSYGQNVLTHSVEMAHVSGMLAAELGANVDIAKTGALLHDIGKAIDHDVEGTHVQLGRKILKKYGIDERVIRAMESHHEEYPFTTSESLIVAAADALSAGRPGARRDSLENYVKRLGDLETLAQGFDGVKSAYALSAGREVRVFVVPEKIDDFGALRLAKEISAKIQGTLKYPGEIKINVIRELRAVEFAR